MPEAPDRPDGGRRVEILECTLRDGSYAIDYQFTAEDTAVIAAGLEQAGLRYIEIGHGLGLDASTPQIGSAAATDEEYLKAAASVLDRALFGTFFIPGIGTADSLARAAALGMGFVRVGTNVTEVEQAEPYIRQAKELGLVVSSNLMKSYAVPVDEFMDRARLVASWGADIVTVVDSAGGMLPGEVSEYIARLREEVGVTVGFHGHNNLDLAIANTVAAVEAGAGVVDSSLQGMGRSAGNAQTELLVVVLEKLGFPTGIDLYGVMDMGDKLIGPLPGHGVDSLSAIMGYAQFHSSYLDVVQKVAARYGLDPRELIVNVSEVDRVRVTSELADRVARDMAKSGPRGGAARRHRRPERTFLAAPRGQDLGDTASAARSIAQQMVSLARKTSKEMVFTIAGTWARDRTWFPYVRQSLGYVIGNAEVPDAEEAAVVARAVDGLVDHVFVDTSDRGPSAAGLIEAVRKAVTTSDVFAYNDVDVQAQAIVSLVEQLPAGARGAVVCLAGEGRLREAVEASLARCRPGDLEPIPTESAAAETLERCGVLLAVSPMRPVVPVELVGRLPSGAVIVDGGPGGLTAEAIAAAHERGHAVYRVDMRAALSSEIVRVLETDSLIRRSMGSGTLAGVPIVAGGLIGRLGDVVVDSLGEPSIVIGVADGKGGLLAAAEVADHTDAVTKVRRAIAYGLLSD